MAGKPKRIWSQEVINYLRNEYEADLDRGCLYHKIDNGRHWSRGDIQKTHVDAHGYVGFNISTPSGERMRLKMHQVIIFFKTGKQPMGLIDHKDRNKQNNAECNLVETDDRGNQTNRRDNTKKGDLKATPHCIRGNWMLYIVTEDFGKWKYVKGAFKTKQEALDYGLSITMPTV